LGLGCSPLPPADLTILNGPEPSSLDPLLLSGIEELRAVQPIFEGLTRTDPRSGRAVPGLAGQWDLVDQGRTYIFHLRPEAAWSTGDPIRATDVDYSWRRVLEPTNGCPYGSVLFPVRGAEDYATGKSTDPSSVGLKVLDPLRFQVELNYPCPYFLDACALPTLAVVPRKAIEQHRDRWVLSHPVPTSGPYQVEFWRLNDRVRLRKNDHYWDAAHTQCAVVDLLSITSPNTVLNLFHRGDAQIIWDKPLVPTELLPILSRQPEFHSFPMLGTYFLRINTTRKPLDDRRVRQALAFSVNKRHMTQRVTALGEEPAQHLVPTVTAHYSRGEGQPHDPDQARALLEAAGFPAGKGFPVLTLLIDSAGNASSRVNERMAIELKSMWEQELGLRVELRRMEKKSYLLAQDSLDYDVVRSSWIGDYNDPNTFLELFMSSNGNNRTGWSSPRYDELLRAAAAEPDLTQRARLLQEAETLLVRDEVPIIPLWFEVGFNLYDPKVIQGIYPNAVDIHPINGIRHQRPEGHHP